MTRWARASWRSCASRPRPKRTCRRARASSTPPPTCATRYSNPARPWRDPPPDAGLYEWSQGSTLQFREHAPRRPPALRRSRSATTTRARTRSPTTGSRVFWTASQETPAHLYMRNTHGRTHDPARQGPGRPDRTHGRGASSRPPPSTARVSSSPTPRRSSRGRPANRNGKSATCTSAKSPAAAPRKAASCAT